MKKPQVGKKYDFTMSPSVLRGWTVLRFTKKCVVIAKDFPNGAPSGYNEIHLPIKLVTSIKEVKTGDENNEQKR